ncbi:MlaE family ABC transporter permease [Pleionea sediminis]|uniref:MlaE family ABC transporter permease n=1 Tax=Pleionea sediminis TaxID=2569479 RepID=UPI001186BE6E|nr:ABC transporter permease [Pleionea sediminis]
MINAVSQLGIRFIDACEHIGHLTLFMFNVLRKMFSPPFRYRAVLKEFYLIGAKSVFVIVLASLTVGLVLGLRLYFEFEQFGVTERLGSVVALSMITEMGPVFTSLLIIGRSGSAMCAEIGIMRSDEQLDALECMAIDPYKFLMVPKFWATLMTVPLLVAIADVVGIFGGYIASVVMFDVASGSYLQSMYGSVGWHDLNIGLVKSIIFALIIVSVSTGKGFILHLDKKGSYGAEGVSRVTTQAVVMASVTILFADYLISAFMV